MNIKNRFAITVGICALASFAQNASAESSHVDNLRKLSSIVMKSIEHNEDKKRHDFTKSSVAQADTDEISGEVAVEVDDNKRRFKSDDDDFADRLMKRIPYHKSLRYTWDIADGDVDIYFENLRVDRRNKGLSYKTDSLPMIGKMDGAELEANLGGDSKLTFKSDYMPLVGRVDGFQFRASAGTDDRNISLRYKVDISW